MPAIIDFRLVKKDQWRTLSSFGKASSIARRSLCTAILRKFNQRPTRFTQRDSHDALQATLEVLLSKLGSLLYPLQPVIPSFVAKPLEIIISILGLYLYLLVCPFVLLLHQLC